MRPVFSNKFVKRVNNLVEFVECIEQQRLTYTQEEEYIGLRCYIANMCFLLVLGNKGEVGILDTLTLKWYKFN